MRCLHGERLHVAVHEGAHALAAVERGIPFVDALVYDEPQHLRDDLYMGGRVRLDDERGWRDMPPPPLFEFSLAGVSAELALLQHEVPGGWEEDLAIWRQVVGAFRARPPEAYNAILGEPIPNVRERMASWAAARSSTIAAIAGRLLDGVALREDEIRSLCG